MKPVFARKLTRCNECRDPIAIGERRLEDVVRVRKQILRVHYHPMCAWLRWERWWQENENGKWERTTRGRVLILTDGEKLIRKRLLSRASMLRKHYTVIKPIRTPLDEGYCDQDIERMARYHAKQREIFAELNEVGGVPKGYR